MSRRAADRGADGPAPTQPSLFGDPDAIGPPGFCYREDLITAAQEAELASRVETLPLAPFAFHGYLGNRRTVSFGHRYDYSREQLEAAEAIPGFLLPLRAAAAAFAGLSPERFDHVLVTEYRPGAGIGWHRDKPQFERVVGVSLLAGCGLRFRRRRETGWERMTTQLKPRSAYLLDGQARHVWEHSIAPVAALRYSITFRSRTG